MNDLTISSELQRSFPTLLEGLRKAQRVFDEIRSFEDIERVFLRGAGLAPNTYQSYLQAVKQLYEFTKGLNPLQVTAEWIESFYDALAKRVDRNTARLRVAGLKRFFRGIQKTVPFYVSPFDTMSDARKRKLSRTKKGNRTKKALSKAELIRLLAYLEKDTSLKGLQNHAIVLFLTTTGLRSSETCQLKWKDLEHFEGKYNVSFIGKGDRTDDAAYQA